MFKDLFSLAGRIAVVTGGSRGIGKMIAAGFLSSGAAKVYITARKAAPCEATAKELTAAYGGECVALPIDISTLAGVETQATEVGKREQKLDILVNNAGAAWGAPAESHPLDAWRKVIDLNLTGAFLLTQAVGRMAMLPAGRGRILNIASIEGLRGRPPGMPGTIAYATSKGGMISFTRSLAAEWGPRGITVNAIAPGFFPSKMTRATLERFGAGITARTPLGKLGGPHDLKGAALLFASDAGGHITGQVLAIDGGATVL
ncbi:MAG TPA: SDR family oxidoreductase [Candidatus Sulfotelmatobacter sp.]|nr:SDR family oxidoreductase [Candidatus Sulfotelmatobacter sp.]